MDDVRKAAHAAAGNDSSDPDSALLARVAQGDPVATRMLIAAKLPRVVALAHRLLLDRAEAEDVAQDAFVRVWRHAPDWQPGRARFDTWLHTVVLNLCRDRLRRRREIIVDDLSATVDPSPSFDEDLLARERSARVAAAIAELPERQREAVLLVHYQELSGVEASAALQISIEALESLLARARRSLRQRLASSNEGFSHD